VEVTPKPDDTMEMSDLVGAVRRVMKSIAPIRNIKIQQGFSDPEISLWPATALFLWAGGISWERLRRIIPVDEGDMASLIMRTADHLRQVANLKETHPDLVATALAAIQQILREPVYFD
jgi:superfamily II RNA helicase